MGPETCRGWALISKHVVVQGSPGQRRSEGLVETSEGGAVWDPPRTKLPMPEPEVCSCVFQLQSVRASLYEQCEVPIG